MNFINKVIIIISLFILTLFYQNCSNHFEAINFESASNQSKISQNYDGKEPVGNMPDDKEPVDNMPDDKEPEDNMPDDKEPVDNMPDDKEPVGSMPDDKEPTDSKETYSTTFDNISSKGLLNACYPNSNHYLAEFLYQDHDVCFWKVDESSKTISKLKTPTTPANAIKLPAPSGGDDTSTIEKIINNNPGKSIDGAGRTYKVSNLNINVKIDIFNMPMETANKSANVVVINSPDVRIFKSPIEGKNSSSTAVGYTVNDGAHRFVLVKSGFSNIYHKNKINSAGVRIRGANDFHITCNEFKNIINDIGSNGSKSVSEKIKLNVATARANAIWMNGGNTKSTSGGVIANNYGENFQSNGSRNDAEFFTIQGYNSTDDLNPVRFYANRAVNAGKRMTKSQESNLLALSNKYEWLDKDNGPLGRRTLFAAVNVHFSDNVIARNNRFIVAAQSRFDNIFLTNVKGRSRAQNNIHFDCNDIEIKDKLSLTSGNVPVIIAATTDDKIDPNYKFEATNSSASNNIIHGSGSVKYHYYFDDGYRKDGGRFKIINNKFSVKFNSREFK